jgi:3-hydroxyisobutyrate dehydrogenase-like beta-hydroxyacid dehydrogenase
MERIGFIGIGVMGRPMCLNLRKAGFPLTVYARRPESAGVREVVTAGATLAESPRAVAESSDVVMTMLPDSPEVEEVALGLGPAQGQGVLDGAREGLVVVDMSTIAPSASKRLGAACAARGVAFLDAPVSGGSQGAEAGTLTIMIGGDAAVVERMRPVFAAMGAPENIVHVGSVGTGEVVKLVNQHMCGVIAAASLEALVLGVKAGADVETMARIVGASSGGNGQLANPIRLRAFSGTFEPGFFTDLLVKDLRLVQGLGDELHVPLTLAAVAKQMYEAARAQGYGRDDYTAVVRPLEELTGVEVRSRKSEVGSRE